MSQPILTVEQLQICHAGQSQAVLDQVEFEIRQGEIISILIRTQWSWEINTFICFGWLTFNTKRANTVIGSGN